MTDNTAEQLRAIFKRDGNEKWFQEKNERFIAAILEVLLPERQSIELRAYEATVESLEQRIRQLEALMVPGGFPSDVITAAGLLYHGKRDKVLAERLCIGAQSMLAAAVTPKKGEL